MAADAPTQLKAMFDTARYRRIADLLAAEYPRFDRRRFLRLTTDSLEERSLLQRLRRTTEACRATLPDDYHATVAILRRVAARLDHNFVSLFTCDYVGLYGQEHFDASLEALHHLTRFSSAEFAIREFLKRDLPRTLAVMRTWATDENEHVRRLASEGSRPRLPWSFRLQPLVANPALAFPILEALRSDPSLYVRKSVANHLNDISKDHPEWLFRATARWPREHPSTAWILRRGLRTLVKRGHPRALAAIGATRGASVRVSRFTLQPPRVVLGGEIRFAFTLESRARRPQRLVVDFVVHYVKQSGATRPKVFKLKEVALAPGAAIPLTKRLRLADLSTRRHHPGRHRVEIMVNGSVLAGADFRLFRA